MSYEYYSLTRGEKNYELVNHLGNVLVVISDKKLKTCTGDTVNYYTADVLQVTDYSAFGVILKGREYYANASNQYRNGFNGKEQDDEINGDGNAYDFGARIYEGRLGRWMSVDPLNKEYVPIAPYVFALNDPIYFRDDDGRVIVDPDGNIITVKFKNGTLEFSGPGKVTSDMMEVLLAMYHGSEEGRHSVRRMVFSKTRFRIVVSDNVGIGKSTGKHGKVTYGILYSLMIPEEGGELVEENDGNYFVEGKGHMVYKEVTIIFFLGSLLTDEEVREQKLQYEIYNMTPPKNSPNQGKPEMVKEFDKPLQSSQYPDLTYRNKNELFHFAGVHEEEHTTAKNINTRKRKIEDVPLERERHARWQAASKE